MKSIRRFTISENLILVLGKIYLSPSAFLPQKYYEVLTTQFNTQFGVYKTEKIGSVTYLSDLTSCPLKPGCHLPSPESSTCLAWSSGTTSLCDYRTPAGTSHGPISHPGWQSRQHLLARIQRLYISLYYIHQHFYRKINYFIWSTKMFIMFIIITDLHLPKNDFKLKIVWKRGKNFPRHLRVRRLQSCSCSFTYSQKGSRNATETLK